MRQLIWACLICACLTSEIGNAQTTIMRFENIRMCNEFDGADIGAKINACIADLPSTGGVADARGIVSGTLSTTVTINKANVRLLLGGPFTATASINVTAGGVDIVGNGNAQTAITYAPGMGGSFIQFNTGVMTELFFGSVHDLYILGTNNQQKVGIELIDTSNIHIETTHINLSGSTNDNEGIRLKGRESTYLYGNYVQSDTPLHISDNIDSTIDSDFLSAINNQFIGPLSGTPTAVVLADTGVNITRLTFIHNDFEGGADGFQQIDTTSTQISESWTFVDNFCEQSPVSSAFCVHIERNSLLYNLRLLTLRGPDSQNGIKLRNVRSVTLSNVLYDGSGTFLDINSSNDQVDLVGGMDATNAAATISLGATNLRGCYVQNLNETCFAGGGYVNNTPVSFWNAAHSSTLPSININGSNQGELFTSTSTILAGANGAILRLGMDVTHPSSHAINVDNNRCLGGGKTDASDTLCLIKADGNNAASVGQAGVPLNVVDSVTTTQNCSSSGGSCGSAFNGVVSIAAGATTVTVSSTKVTANSNILLTEDSSVGARLGVTCNTATGRTYTVTSRTAGTSFVITGSAAPATTPACLTFFIIN